MKVLTAALAIAGLIFCSASCDKHSWESTQVLHEGMHKAHHGDDHGKDAHGEKKDAHAKKEAVKH